MVAPVWSPEAKKPIILYSTIENAGYSISYICKCFSVTEAIYFLKINFEGRYESYNLLSSFKIVSRYTKQKWIELQGNLTTPLSCYTSENIFYYQIDKAVKKIINSIANLNYTIKILVTVFNN